MSQIVSTEEKYTAGPFKKMESGQKFDLESRFLRFLSFLTQRSCKYLLVPGKDFAKI